MPEGGKTDDHQVNGQATNENNDQTNKDISQERESANPEKEKGAEAKDQITTYPDTATNKSIARHDYNYTGLTAREQSIQINAPHIGDVTICVPSIEEYNPSKSPPALAMYCTTSGTRGGFGEVEVILLLVAG
jgi:hypothetical protein